MFVLYGLYHTVVNGQINRDKPPAALTPNILILKLQYSTVYSVRTSYLLCDWLLLSHPYQTNSYHSCLV